MWMNKFQDAYLIIFQGSLENGRNPNSINSSHADDIALLVMNNIRKYQKNISTSVNLTGCTASSVRNVQDLNTVGSDNKTSLPHVSPLGAFCCKQFWFFLWLIRIFIFVDASMVFKTKNFKLHM